MRLRIASRKSDLARIQSYEVGKALQNAHPHLEIEFIFSESLGDKNLNDPLWKMPEKGVFTSDLTEDLLQKRADIIVHSWKDLPTQENTDTEVVATLKRADVRDLLLFKKSSRQKLKSGSSLKIYSSSPRRAYNLLPFLSESLPFQPKNIAFDSVRGNVPTRLRKLLEANEIDGLIVAKAAIDRLLATTEDEFAEARQQIRTTLEKCDFMILPLMPNPAAAAQGALAVEIRRDNSEVRGLLGDIHDDRTFAEATAERQILKSYGGGCHQKIGVTILRRPEGRLTFLRGLTDGGQELNQISLFGTARGDAEIVRSSLIFDRKPRAETPNFSQYNALFVAHAAAWPKETKFDGILWTAGLTTWKKMAALGYWVCGSAEGLGDKEDPRLDMLVSGLKWATVSHGKSEESAKGPVIATYDLVAKASAVAPTGQTLHWTSGIVFEEALRRWPDLKNRKHSCGPGKTLEAIRLRIPTVEIRWPLKEKA